MAALRKFILWLNNQNARLVIFLLIVANFIGNRPDGGEEQYFAFAKQFMDPAWMPHSFSLNHPAGGNLLFQVIVGFLLQFLSFEQMAFWGRLVNFTLLAIPLALIFRKLKFSNLEIIFLLQIVFFNHQSIWAGEWIFRNLEEKSVAYIFVLYSIYYLLSEKPVLSSLFAAFATYFHFLVGGWMFAFVITFHLVWLKQLRHVIKSGLSYLLIVSPFVVYLFRVYFIDNPAVINGVNTNAVYAFFRLKHHIGMFGDLNYFFAYHFGGVIISLAMFLTCIFAFSRFNNEYIKKLNLLNIIIFSQQFIFIGIALFDKNGVLMKTYPFRTSTLSALLFMFEAALVYKLYIHKRLYRLLVLKNLKFRNFKFPLRKTLFVAGFQLLLLSFILSALSSKTCHTIRKFNTPESSEDAAMQNLFDYIRAETPRESVFLLLDNDKPYSFIRRTERERFVVEKFTPTKSQTIYEWHKRLLLKEKIKENIQYIDSAKMEYPIDYMISDSLYSYPSLELEKCFGNHYIYAVKKE